MIPAWIVLALNSLFVTLRLSGGESGSFPRPLKAEEERDCLSRMAEGDTQARDRLIEHNLRLVAHIVKKYYTPNGDQDDLISIGTIGLIKGVTTFKSDKNVRLATYASRCIENAILTKAAIVFPLHGGTRKKEPCPVGGFRRSRARFLLSITAQRQRSASSWSLAGPQPAFTYMLPLDDK